MTGMNFLLAFLFVSSLLLKVWGWAMRQINIQSPKVPQSLQLAIYNSRLFKEFRTKMPQLTLETRLVQYATGPQKAWKCSYFP